MIAVLIEFLRQSVTRPLILVYPRRGNRARTRL